MADLPDQILIRCEQCKNEATLTALHKHQGHCPHCGNSTWHVQATYLARQDNSDGTTLTLNALGLNLLSSSGFNLGSPVPGEKRPVNGIDIHDVPANEIMDIASPEVNPQVKLQAFVKRKQNEQFSQHRKAMQQHGSQCEQCGMLFVLNDQKPWTLVGTCSRVCCAGKYGAVDYALIQDQVLESVGQRMVDIRQIQRDNQVIQVCCPACGHRFDLPRMYEGVHRKCPACGQKVLVQHH